MKNSLSKKISKKVIAGLNKPAITNIINFDIKNLSFINNKVNNNIRSFIDILINDAINFEITFNDYRDLSNNKLKVIKISGYISDLQKIKNHNEFYLKTPKDLFFDIQLIKNKGIIINLGNIYKNIVDKSIYKDYKSKLLLKKDQIDSNEIINYLNSMLESSSALKRSKGLSEIL